MEQNCTFAGVISFREEEIARRKDPNYHLSDKEMPALVSPSLASLFAWQLWESHRRSYKALERSQTAPELSDDDTDCCAEPSDSTHTDSLDDIVAGFKQGPMWTATMQQVYEDRSTE